ncbi:MAG: hypothetical protein HQK63_04155 [Desulfamplus sp.]|nr:hypothetical protein [Desulfamplus sp.]
MFVTQPAVPKIFLNILNHLYEIERKVAATEELKKISRNIERIKDSFRNDIPTQFQDSDIELYYEDPMGQVYDETRNDLEATIAGESTENLVVVDVIKPIIRLGNKRNKISYVVQKGIVIVESTLNKNEDISK